MVQQSEPTSKCTLQDFGGMQEVLAIASSKNTLTSTLATELNSLLPSSASTVMQQWNSSTLEDCTWVSTRRIILYISYLVFFLRPFSLIFLSISFSFSHSVLLVPHCFSTFLYPLLSSLSPLPHSSFIYRLLHHSVPSYLTPSFSRSHLALFLSHFYFRLF